MKIVSWHHADGQTDTTKITVAFRNFANAPEIVKNVKKHSAEHSLVVSVVIGTAAIQLRVCPVAVCVTTLCTDVSSGTAVVDIHKGKGKGTVHLRTGHKGPDG
jgi:predicted class III extradiol MEMO1 family dioxygenase